MSRRFLRSLAFTALIPLCAVVPRASAAPSKAIDKYRLSPSARLKWPEAFQAEVTPLPGLHGIWIEARAGDGAFTAWVSRFKPRYPAAEDSVRRDWAAALAEDSPGRKVSDRGCSALGPKRFRCEWTAGPGSTAGATAQAVYWNGDADLILVRVEGARTENEARSHLAAIGVSWKSLERKLVKKRRKAAGP